MKLPRFTYHRPESLEEALALLAEHDDVKVLAGGQSLIPLMALRLGAPEHLVDIARLPELADVRDDDGTLAVGAGVTHARAERSEQVEAAAPLLARALPQIGHQAIRSRGTVCGSLAHADPAAELPAVAVASGASVVVRSVRGERVVPAAEFFQGYLSTALEPDELIVEVRFPAFPETTGAAVVELSRRHGDFALIGVAATVDVADGTVAACSLVFFGAGAVPRRVEDAEAALVGAPPVAGRFDEAAAIVSAQLDPPDDIHGSRAYRKHVAGVLTRRALTEATT